MRASGLRHMKTRRPGSLINLFFLLLFILVSPLLVTKVLEILSAKEITAIRVTLPDGDRIGYGWQVGWYRRFYTFLSWQTGKEVNKYLIDRSEDPLHLPGPLEIRSTPDSEKIWLVRIKDRRILATLDRSAYEFNGQLRDGSHSLKRQEQWQSSYVHPTPFPPAWATAKGGKVLAILTEEDMWRAIVKARHRGK